MTIVCVLANETDDVIKQPGRALGQSAKQYVGVMGAGVDIELAWDARRMQPFIKGSCDARWNGTVRVAVD